MSNNIYEPFAKDIGYSAGNTNSEAPNKMLKIISDEDLFMSFYHDGPDPAQEGADIERFMKSESGRRALEVAQAQRDFSQKEHDAIVRGIFKEIYAETWFSASAGYHYLCFKEVDWHALKKKYVK